MSNVIPLPDKARARREAALWVARLDRGLSDAEEAKLREWLSEDASHGDMLLTTAGLWDKMEDLSRLSSLFDRPRQVRPRPAWRWPAAMAASIVGVLLATLWLLPISPEPATSPMAGHYETAVGEQAVVNLADGSELTLNTHSRVRVDYSRQARILRLERGELHIDVAHDAERPLSVLVQDKIVQAVGTAFNVRMTHGQRVELIVSEGKVAVREGVSGSESERQARRPLGAADVLAVNGGEKLVLGNTTQAVQRLDPKALSDTLSWREGKLVFRGETLARALEEINRYTTTQFEFADPALAEIRIAGLFQTGDVPGLLNALEQNFAIRAESLPGNRVRLSSAAQDSQHDPDGISYP